MARSQRDSPDAMRDHRRKRSRVDRLSHRACRAAQAARRIQEFGNRKVHAIPRMRGIRRKIKQLIDLDQRTLPGDTGTRMTTEADRAATVDQILGKRSHCRHTEIVRDIERAHRRHSIVSRRMKPLTSTRATSPRRVWRYGPCPPLLRSPMRAGTRPMLPRRCFADQPGAGTRTFSATVVLRNAVPQSHRTMPGIARPARVQRRSRRARHPSRQSATHGKSCQAARPFAAAHRDSQRHRHDPLPPMHE